MYVNRKQNTAFVRFVEMWAHNECSIMIKIYAHE